MFYNQEFIKNTKNEDSKERNVHIVHEHRSRRYDAIVFIKCVG